MNSLRNSASDFLFGISLPPQKVGSNRSNRSFAISRHLGKARLPPDLNLRAPEHRLAYFRGNLSWDFRRLSDPTRGFDQMASVGKGLAGFGPRCFQRRREEAGFASDGRATPVDALFPNGSADTFPFAPASSSKFASLCARLIPRRRRRRDLPQHAGKQ